MNFDTKMFPELDLNKYSPKNVLALHKIVETGGLINITKWRSVEADPTITQVEFFKKDVADGVGSSSFPTPGVYLFSYFFFFSPILLYSFLLQKFRLIMDHPLPPR